LWFFAAHIPHTGVLLPVNSLFLEHWMYLPSIGLIGGLLWFAAGTPVFRPAGVPDVAVIPVTFYTNILSHAKGNARVHNNLGMAHSERGMGELAIEQYLKAIAFKDVYPQVRHNLAEEYMKLGQFPEAIAQLKRAIEINPQFYYSYRNLAAIYQRLGDQKRAEHYYNLYQQLRPE
jgi:Tfp pilus assembly protein PilF